MILANENNVQKISVISVKIMIVDYKLLERDNFYDDSKICWPWSKY